MCDIDTDIDTDEYNKFNKSHQIQWAKPSNYTAYRTLNYHCALKCHYGVNNDMVKQSIYLLTWVIIVF